METLTSIKELLDYEEIAVAKYNEHQEYIQDIKNSIHWSGKPISDKLRANLEDQLYVAMERIEELRNNCQHYRNEIREALY